jgi:hypothetical protein
LAYGRPSCYEVIQPRETHAEEARPLLGNHTQPRWITGVVQIIPRC